ncbi:MAG: alpha-glucosidase [Bacteroidota bacterium]
MSISSIKHEDADFVWWKHGVIYHIYPLSFCDANADGKGDLQGIINKIYYLNDLGITAIWLSPIYQSPQKDFGYDISNYYEIDPIYGRMADFDALVAACHQLNIRIIMDLVLNHTSDEHPWFIESKSSRDNEKRDWYIWSDGLRRKPVNNWQNAFGGSAWVYHRDSAAYYMHSFLKEQPDLNWRCEAMAQEFVHIIDFWLEKGVDGFRLDVINLVVKDKRLRSNPMFMFIPWFQTHVYNRNQRGAFKLIEQLRKHIDTYDHRMLIGEIYVLPPGNTKMVMKYVNKKKKRLHLAFDFSLVFRPFNARIYYKYANKWNKKGAKVEWASHVFSNHDLGRNINRIWFRRNKAEVAKLIALFQFTLKGTPFVYYGEEIGMRNVKIRKQELKDPLSKKLWPVYSGRDKCRTPMQWDETPNAGFSMVQPWLPIDKNFKKLCVEAQLKSDDSMLQHYKFLIALRNAQPALNRGEWIPYIKGRDGILAYHRRHLNDEFLIIINFKAQQKLVILPNIIIYKVIYSTIDGAVDSICRNVILMRKSEGVILQPVFDFANYASE